MNEDKNNDKNRESGEEQQQHPNRGAYPPYPSPYYMDEEEEVSLLDMLLVVARHKKLILYTTGICVILGLLIAIFSSPEYTSSATLIRETESQQAGLGGLSSIGRGFGINIGGKTTGLTAEAYPDIIKSREVRLAVVRDSFYFEHLENSLTLTEYYSREGSLISKIIGGIKGYTIGLPGKVLGLFSGEPEKRMVLTEKGKRIYPTEEEENAMEAVAGMLSVNIDRETGLMTVSITSGDPLYSAKLAESYITHLKERIRRIKTKKARENLQFVQERFREAEGELHKAEEKLAKFLDRNTNPQTAELRTEQQRQQRQVNFKSQLFSDLQTQLTQSQIELQRSEPVITVLEKSVPPMEKSGPNRKLTIILSLLLGGGLGIGGAFVLTSINNMKSDEEQEDKLQEIKQRLVPQRWRSE